MIDYISHIADLLNQGVPVIFYTVGGGTFCHIRELKTRFGKEPTAVCDGDIKKQGKTFFGLENLQVISPQEAIKRFPDFRFFICSLDYRYQIIGYLTESCGISPERIINYVSVKKMRSCMLLQKAVLYDKNGDIHFCCQNPSPFVAASDTIDAKEVLQLRNTLLQNIEKGITTNTPCDGCSRICVDYYPEKPLSWSINYFCHGICNYKCSYCTLRNHEDTDQRQGKQKLQTLLQQFQDVGLLGENYSVCLSTAGEPTIHPDRKEFYEASNGAELIVNTNGYVFDPDLYETMNLKKVLLICSVDSGTPETYHKVKGVDGFVRMKENLSHYAQASIGIVALKYIFVPGLNDTLNDVEGFVNLCIDVNATFVLVAMDYFSVNQVSEHTHNMISYLNQKLSDLHILCVPYTGYETTEYGNMMRELLQ